MREVVLGKSQKTQKSLSKMNKNQSKLFDDLIKAIAANSNLKLSEAEAFVNEFIKTVSEELKNRRKVTLVGFGTFAVAHRKAKTGVNPKTGAKLTIPAKDVPVFKPGKALKELVK